METEERVKEVLSDLLQDFLESILERSAEDVEGMTSDDCDDFLDWYFENRKNAEFFKEDHRAGWIRFEPGLTDQKIPFTNSNKVLGLCLPKDEEDKKLIDNGIVIPFVEGSICCWTGQFIRDLTEDEDDGMTDPPFEEIDYWLPIQPYPWEENEKDPDED